MKQRRSGSGGGRGRPLRAEGVDLTPRQHQILDFIDRYAKAKGFPPTVREIQNAVGLQSTSSVHAQLKNLEVAGHIKREPSLPRALGIARAAARPEGRPGTVVEVRLVGRIAAGDPRAAIEAPEDRLLLSWGAFRQVRRDDVEADRLFLLRVSGDSMVGAGINDGDLVLVKKQETADSGDVVVAVVGGETTVKRLRISRTAIALEPENPFYPTIEAKPSEVEIAGKVVGLIRPDIR